MYFMLSNSQLFNLSCVLNILQLNTTTTYAKSTTLFTYKSKRFHFSLIQFSFLGFFPDDRRFGARESLSLLLSGFSVENFPNRTKLLRPSQHQNISILNVNWEPPQKDVYLQFVTKLGKTAAFVKKRRNLVVSSDNSDNEMTKDFIILSVFRVIYLTQQNYLKLINFTQSGMKYLRACFLL